MSCTTRRGRLRALALICSTSALGGTALIGSTGASAASDSWNCTAPTGQSCPGPRHSLTSASSYSGSDAVTSGAVGSKTGKPEDPWGQWATGAPYACRVYGGGNLLTPFAKNVNGSTRTIFGGSTWGSGSSGC